MAEATVKRVVIEEYLGSADAGRLGRHVEHDERSRGFAATAGPVTSLRTLRRKRRIKPFNQGDLGSCTGNASTGATATAPFKNPLRARSNSQKIPLQVYGKATELDGFPGTYKPDDTGSSGLAAAKALQQMGAITSYQHAFSTDAWVHAAANPNVGLIFGIPWYDSFDQPDVNGIVHLTPGAQVRGGHEIQCDGIVLSTQGTYSGSDIVWFWQSWGRWGLNDTGAFGMSVNDLAQCMANDGDCTILVP